MAETKNAPAKKTAAKKAAPAKKAPARRQRVAVDDRTKTMTAEALTCRSWGHAPTRLPVPAPERVRLSRIGQRLVILGCRNQCGYTRHIILDAGNAAVIHDRVKYEDPKGYLVQEKGAGRLPRQSSRQAFLTQLADD